MKASRSIAIWATGVLVLGGVAVPRAHAASVLEGRHITTAFYFPDQATIGFGGVPVQSVVGAGVEIAGSPQGFPIASIDFSDTSIRLDFFYTLSGTLASFNGWRFYDADNSLPSFTSATLTTALPGWSVSFDPDNIWLNGSGASYLAGSNLRIDVTAVTAVPEPETYALMLVGLAIVGFAARRRST